MEPLRVVVGGGQSLEEIAGRLERHDASAAPLVRAGLPVGILTREQVESACRHGLGGLSGSEIVAGGAPRVGAATSLRRVGRAARGIAPALLVGEPRGPLRGILDRRRLGSIEGESSADDMTRRLERRLGRDRMRLLRSFGRLAGGRKQEGLFLVGGVLRDVLSCRDGGDLDLVLVGDGVAFAGRAARHLGSPGWRVMRHASFGTATIKLPDGTRIDIASARHESYRHPAALPDVVPGTLFDDLRRRDVTINSMAVRLDGRSSGRLADLLGGAIDLRRGLVRVNHVLGIVEDPTRAFRLARFAARLGFSLAEETRRGLSLARRFDAYARLGGERLRREMTHVMREPDPAGALGMMGRLGLLRTLDPGIAWGPGEAAWMRRLVSGLRDGVLRGWKERQLPPDLLLLGILLRKASPGQRRHVAERLRITGRGRDRLLRAVEDLRALERRLSRATRASRITRCCDAVSPLILALAWSTGSTRTRAHVARYLSRLRHVRPGITGRTLEKMGLPRGREYRKILDDVRDAWLDGHVASRADEEGLARRLIARRRVR